MEGTTTATTTIPNVIPAQAVDAAPAATEAPSFKDSIPEAYREKAYMEKISDMDGLYKSFDSMQEMIGKRPSGIPQENDSPEAWSEFYKQQGRPDTADGYEITYPEGTEINQEGLSQFKEFAHEQGFTPKQVKALAEFDLARNAASQEGFNGEHEKVLEGQKAELDKLTNEQFGDRKQEVMDSGDELVMKYLPESMDEHFKALDPQSKALLATVLDGIKKDYISEDSSLKGETPAAPTGDAMLAEAHQLMQSEAFKNEFHIDNDATRKRVQDIYQKLG